MKRNSNLTLPTSVTRRHCLGAVAAVAGSLSTSSSLLARPPIDRKGPPRLRLSVAAYCFRHYFAHFKGKPQTPRPLPAAVAGPWTVESLLDYCVIQGIDAAELTAYFFPTAEDGWPLPKVLRQTAVAAFQKNVSISGTAIGNDFTVAPGQTLDRQVTDALRWLEVASQMGAPHVRFFAGNAQRVAEDAARLTQAIAAIRTCGLRAEQLGITIGVENHGGLGIDAMLRIVREVETPNVGLNVDTGNFASADVYADIAAAIPYAVNVQLKPHVTDAAGNRSPADVMKIIGLLRDGGYQGYVTIEYEGETPFEDVPRLIDELRQII